MGKWEMGRWGDGEMDKWEIGRWGEEAGTSRPPG